MAKRTIGTDRLIDGVKIDNLPSDTNAELAGKQDTLGYNPLQSIQAGTNIAIDNTDPLNPVISATGMGTGDVTASGTLTDDTIILGNGNTSIKSSSKTIVTTLGSDDATIPTSKAVQDVTDIKANSFTTSHITTSVNPAVPFTTYLVNASGGNVTITLPNASNTIDEYRIILEENTHYVTVTTVGGTQLIGGLTSQIISTVGGGIYIKASTDHYDIISDTRNLERVVDVTTNIDLSTSGYENTTTYHCIPSGGTITVTLPDSSSVIAGTTVRFTLHGTGSVVIKTLSEELIEGQQEQVINVNGAIRLVNDGTHYWIDTDTRAKVQNSAVTFYSLSENSAISDGLGGYYKQSSTSTTDARYSGTSAIVTTGTIGTDTYLFGGISDEGVIQGILPEGPSTTTVNIARNTGSASFRFYIKFYKYSGGVETLIGTSSMSNVIDTTTIAEYTVTTNLSQTTFASTDRIIRKLFATSGGSPTAKVSVEGASPSFSTISSPATSIGHNSLAGIQEAGSGVTNGHITDQAQTIYGPKTFNSSPIVPTPTGGTDATNKNYVDGLVNGLLDYRGGYDASSNTFPTSGGSGVGGTVLKGDMWVISVAGTLGGQPVQVGDSIIANIDYPINSLTNWDILNSNISYVPEDVANKKTTMTGNETSNTSYLSAKAVYDWVTSLGGGGSQTYEAYIAGELTTGRIYRQVAIASQTLTGVKITTDTLPVGANLQVQVYKNGIASTNSIFTSDTPIEITTGQGATNGVYTTTKTTIDNGTLAENDIIYIYITQIGSTLSSTNLSVICY